MNRPVTLVACSHGTRSPAARALVSALANAVGARLPRARVVEMFVDVEEPSLTATLPCIDGEVVVVPLFLSGGYHVHHDIGEAAANHPSAMVSAPLGPDEVLADLQAERLKSAGLGRSDVVVMGASASSDGRAVRDVRRAAALLSERLDAVVEVGVVGGQGVSVRAAVAAARRAGRRVAVSSYLLMPGFFHSQLLASGADLVSDPLLNGGPPVTLVDLVERRFDALSMRRVA